MAATSEEEVINLRDGRRAIIRSAKPREFEEQLPKLASCSYQDRFYNDETALKETLFLEEKGELQALKEKGELQREDLLREGGSLTVYPEMVPNKETGEGQSLESFKRYWQEKREEFERGDFFCFVVEDFETKELLGFTKGSRRSLDEESFGNLAEQNTEFAALDRTKVFEIGSTYVDPEAQRLGVGGVLRKAFMKDFLEKCPDCQGAVVTSYEKNTSQFFNAKMGADYLGKTLISDTYLALESGKLTRAVCEIPGETMFWSGDKVKAIAEGRKVEMGYYSRRSSRVPAILETCGSAAAAAESSERTFREQ